MKKILSLIVALAMVLSCTAALAEDMTVVVMPKLVGIPYFNASETGALAAGEELGINVIYTGPTTGDAALQVQMIEDLLIDGIDALAIAPNDPDSVSPALQKCQADGVLVMDWDTTANGDDVTYSIQQIDNKVLGEMLFDLLVEAMGTDEGEYAIVTGYLTAANLNTWIDFGKAYAAEKYPNLTLVTDPVPSDESAQEAYTQTMALIAAYPNLKGIIGYSTAPLRLATVLGTISGIGAVLYLISVLLEKLIRGIYVPGYATIIVLILFFGSVQLFCIGIIGEYVGRTFEQSKDRPNYIAKEVLSYEEEEKEEG